MFKTPEDEDNLCKALKAYVEEWGAENVTVKLPAAWKDSKGLPSVITKFCTINTIELQSSFNGSPMTTYKVQIQC